MTTPRIEEILKKLWELMPDDVARGGNETFYNTQIEPKIRRALTEAHQAGRDEEVGKCNYLKIVTHRVFIHPDDEKKNIPPVFEANVELQNVDTNRITYPTVLFKYDTIKPLQDNK